MWRQETNRVCVGNWRRCHLLDSRGRIVLTPWAVHNVSFFNYTKRQKRTSCLFSNKWAVRCFQGERASSVHLGRRRTKCRRQREGFSPRVKQRHRVYMCPRVFLVSSASALSEKRGSTSKRSQVGQRCSEKTNFARRREKGTRRRRNVRKATQMLIGQFSADTQGEGRRLKEAVYLKIIGMMNRIQTPDKQPIVLSRNPDLKLNLLLP